MNEDNGYSNRSEYFSIGVPEVSVPEVSEEEKIAIREAIDEVFKQFGDDIDYFLETTSKDKIILSVIGKDRETKVYKEPNGNIYLLKGSVKKYLRRKKNEQRG